MDHDVRAGVSVWGPCFVALVFNVTCYLRGKQMDRV